MFPTTMRSSRLWVGQQSRVIEQTRSLLLWSGIAPGSYCIRGLPGKIGVSAEARRLTGADLEWIVFGYGKYPNRIRIVSI